MRFSHTYAKCGPGRRLATSRPGRANHVAGFSLVEVLVVVLMLGLVAVGAAVVWQQSWSRTEAKSAARAVKVMLHQARMTSIYEGVNHFVVLNDGEGTVEVYADSGTTPGSFDSDDPMVARSSIHSGVTLTLPTDPANLSSPLDGTNLTNAWSLPAPDTSARWGTELLGVMTTPTGRIESAEATPAAITTGVIVFSTPRNETAAVGIRGIEGSARSFEFFKGAWREL